MHGKVKLEKNHAADKMINDYLGVKKEKGNKGSTVKAKRKGKKAEDSD